MVVLGVGRFLMSEVPLYYFLLAAGRGERESFITTSTAAMYRGSSLIRNCPPLWDHQRALGIALL